jgi:hypothetical protein
MNHRKEKMRFHSLKSEYSLWRIGSLLMELSNLPWRPRNELIAIFPRSGFPQKSGPGSGFNEMDANHCMMG